MQISVSLQAIMKYLIEWHANNLQARCIVMKTNIETTHDMDVMMNILSKRFPRNFKYITFAGSQQLK